MKALAIILITFITTAMAQEVKWSTYAGAWFSIQYPPGFSVRPSQKSSTSKGYDSAFFLSPDGLVTFYVYSPQWCGVPRDIGVKEKIEKIISESRSEKDGQEYTWTTLRSRDGSSFRSFVIIYNKEQNICTAFGIQYRDQNAYTTYRDRYLRFKRSLVQYGD